LANENWEKVLGWRALMPLVEGFDQDVRVAADRSSGRPRR
jgi:hypothetical protein